MEHSVVTEVGMPGRSLCANTRRCFTLGMAPEDGRGLLLLLILLHPRRLQHRSASHVLQRLLNVRGCIFRESVDTCFQLPVAGYCDFDLGSYVRPAQFNVTEAQDARQVREKRTHGERDPWALRTHTHGGHSVLVKRGPHEAPYYSLSCTED
jgi:hypothetical protein